jgi:hypothetical protein
MPGETKLNPDDMREDVKIDFLWAGKHNDQIRSIVLRHYPEIDDRLRGWHEASAEEDMRRATDFVLDRLSVASRVRRSGYSFRDLTLRNKRPSGFESERAKIARGAGDIAFYGWANEDDTIGDYVIVDLHAMRQTGLIDDWYDEIPNTDGSSTFCVWRIEDLGALGCIIAKKLGNA